MIRSRLSSALAALAALGFVVEGAIVVRTPQGDSHWHTSGYVVEAAFVIGLAAALPMLGELRRSNGRLARWAVAVARVGFAAMFAAAVPSLALGRDVLGPVFLLGVGASVLSLLVLAATAARDRGPAWWIAPLAFAGLLVGIALGDQGGGIVMGIAWLGVALGLREAGPQPAASFA